MKPFRWNESKNLLLKETRNICFDDLSRASILDDRRHHNRENQRIMVVQIDNYIHIVPYIENDDHYFLKTIFPDRKEQKKYSLPS